MTTVDENDFRRYAVTKLDNCKQSSRSCCSTGFLLFPKKAQADKRDNVTSQGRSSHLNSSVI
jgi:hypothetical protein